jgi:hypothetical protein
MPRPGNPERLWLSSQTAYDGQHGSGDDRSRRADDPGHIVPLRELEPVSPEQYLTGRSIVIARFHNVLNA